MFVLSIIEEGRLGIGRAESTGKPENRVSVVPNMGHGLQLLHVIVPHLI